MAVLVLQIVIGVVGFYFHLVADINGLSSSLFENFVHGAPVFAPLLFVDLMLLATIGLWDMLSNPVHRVGRPLNRTGYPGGAVP